MTQISAGAVAHRGCFNPDTRKPGVRAGRNPLRRRLARGANRESWAREGMAAPLTHPLAQPRQFSQKAALFIR